MAVSTDEGKVRLLPDCALPGKYTELKTRRRSGRLWITNRALMVLDEVASESCAEATHQVVAFAVGGVQPAPAKTETKAPIQIASPSAFAAILVPLPCPSITDTSAARGCIARGLTGAERQAKAHDLMKKLGRGEMSKVDPADTIAVYAIAPDDDRARDYVGRTQTECSMDEQITWVIKQYSREAEGETGESIVRVLPPSIQIATRLPWSSTSA